jgi:hypothetical protein
MLPRTLTHQNVFHLQKEDSKKRYIQFTLNWILGFNIPLYNLEHTEETTLIFSQFNASIDSLLQTTVDDFAYDQKQLEIRNPNLENLLIWTSKAMLFIKSKKSNDQSKQTVIASFESQFLKLRCLWKELQETSALDLRVLTKRSNLVFRDLLANLQIQQPEIEYHYEPEETQSQHARVPDQSQSPPGYNSSSDESTAAYTLEQMISGQSTAQK